MAGKKKILGISGSLRSNSSTALLMKQAARLMPEDIEFTLYDGLGKLPHFDDSENRPEEVNRFCQLLADADGVMIISPEYAFGVPGSLKNALDWTVSSGEFVDKPLSLVIASTGGEKAYAALLMIFTALSADIPENGKLLISFIRSKIDQDGNIKDEITYYDFKRAIDSLVGRINEKRAMEN